MNTKVRAITIIGLLSVVGLLIGWDVYVVAVQAKQATISEVCLSFFYRHPTVGITLGCILGHLFWPILKPRPDWKTLVVVAATALCMILVDVLLHPPAVTPILTVLMGIVLGHFLWPQPLSTEAEGAPAPAPAPMQTPPPAPKPPDATATLPPPEVRM